MGSTGRTFASANVTVGGSTGSRRGLKYPIKLVFMFVLHSTATGDEKRPAADAHVWVRENFPTVWTLLHQRPVAARILLLRPLVMAEMILAEPRCATTVVTPATMTRPIPISNTRSIVISLPGA